MADGPFWTAAHSLGCLNTRAPSQVSGAGRRKEAGGGGKGVEKIWRILAHRSTSLSVSSSSTPASVATVLSTEARDLIGVRVARTEDFTWAFQLGGECQFWAIVGGIFERSKEPEGGSSGELYAPPWWEVRERVVIFAFFHKPQKQYC